MVVHCTIFFDFSAFLKFFIKNFGVKIGIARLPLQRGCANSYSNNGLGEGLFPHSTIWIDNVQTFSFLF